MACLRLAAKHFSRPFLPAGSAQAQNVCWELPELLLSMLSVAGAALHPSYFLLCWNKGSEFTSTALSPLSLPLAAGRWHGLSTNLTKVRKAVQNDSEGDGCVGWTAHPDALDKL